MLTDKLRGLERDGIVVRRVVERPLEVHYELTELGRSLIGPLSTLRAWAEDNYPAVRAARERFEAGLGAGVPA